MGLCERFGCLPSRLNQESTELLRLLKYEAYGKPEEVIGDDQGV